MIRMPYETLGILFWAIAESLTHGSNQQVIFYHTNTIKNIILNKYLISQNIKLLDLKMWSLKGFFPHFFNVLLRAGGQVCKLSIYKKKIHDVSFQPVFVNNPICGLLIYIAAFIPSWKIGLATVLGGTIATLGEMVGTG